MVGFKANILKVCSRNLRFGLQTGFSHQVVKMSPLPKFNSNIIRKYVRRYGM